MENLDIFLRQYSDLLPKPQMPGEKDHTYYLDMVRYFLSNLANEAGNLIFAGTSFGPSRRTHKELRNYARGLQSIDKYLLQLGYSNNEIETFRKQNISHAPAPIYPKFRNIIISKFLDLHLKAIPAATNPEADFERLMRKNRMKFMTDPRTTERIPPEMLGSMEPGVSAPSDVDYMYEIGGILLPIEIALQDALKYTMNTIDFEQVIKMLIEDLVDIGGMACDIRTVNGKHQIDYVDFTRVITRSSIYPDFKDSDVRGYTIQRKISELMLEDEQAIKDNWDQIKEAYRGRMSLDTQQYHTHTYGHREDYSAMSNPAMGYADFGTTVLKLYWLDVEEQTYISGVHPRNHRMLERVPYDFNLSDRAKRAGKRLERFPIQYMYQANLIMGTDIIFNYGKVDDIVRQGEAGASKIIWPMPIYAAQEPSITEKVIPFVDDLQLAIEKRRDLIAKMPPGPRMLIYKNRIRDSIKLGNQTYTVRDLLRLYQREGLLILDEDDDYSLPGEAVGQNRPPVEFMPSGIAEDLQILESVILVSIERIQQITGINPVVDGTATKGDILKSVAESMQQSANNVLRPWLVDYIRYYKRVSENLAWRYQTMVINSEIDLTYTPLNSSFVKYVHLGRELLKYDIGIRVEIADNDYYQFLLQDLLAKRDLLPPESYFAIFNAIKDRDLKKAEWLLIKFTKKAKEEEAQLQRELVQIQSEQNAKAGIAVEQAKTAARMRELQAQLDQLREQANLDETKAQNDHARDIEKILVKAKSEGDANVDVVRENKQNSVFKSDNK